MRTTATPHSSSTTSLTPDVVDAICRFTPVFYFCKQEKYMPASFPYLAERGVLTHKGTRVALDKLRAVATKMAKGQHTAETMKYFGNVPNDDLLLNVGKHQGDTGYSGKPDPKSELYGDPGETTITAYTSGVLEHSDGIRFIDVVYAVYFAWNGSSRWHPSDVEYVTLRLQYTPSSARSSPYAQLQYHDIITDQGYSDVFDKWCLVRAFCSAHDNGMWFPTKYPGGSVQNVLFTTPTSDVPARPIFFSAQGSHAMYVAAGVQKRMFGFANDVTEKGTQWNPRTVSLFKYTNAPKVSIEEHESHADPSTDSSKAHEHDNKLKPAERKSSTSAKNRPLRTVLTSSSASSTATRSYTWNHVVYDISAGPSKKQRKEVTKYDELLYLAVFCGKIGNTKWWQRTIPFKPNALNTMTSIDAYYKFQHGGNINAINNTLSNGQQKTIMGVTAAIMAVLVIYWSYGTLSAAKSVGFHNPRHYVGSALRGGTSLLFNISLVTFMCIFFIGDRNGESNVDVLTRVATDVDEREKVRESN